VSGQLSQGLRVSMDDLYFNAPAFGQAGGEIATAVTAAQKTLQGLGRFWGNDASGAEFGSFYPRDQDRLLTAIGLATAQVQGIGDGINAMAATYGISEQQNIGKIQALGREGL
jgi:hypothetical protein